MGNKLVMTIIGVVVGIILVSSLLMPVVNDAEHQGATKVINESSFEGEMVGTGTSQLIVSGSHNLVVDGDIFTDYNYEAIVSDSFVLSINAASNNIFYTKDGVGNWSAISGANIEINGVSKTITLSNIEHASSNDNISGDSLTVPYESYCYHRSASGPFVEARSIGSFEVNNSEQVYAAAFASNTYISWNGSETLANGAEVSGTITLTAVSGESGLYSLGGASYGSQNAVWYVVPLTVYGDSSGSGQAIYGVIPVMILVALLVSFIAMVRVKE